MIDSRAFRRVAGNSETLIGILDELFATRRAESWLVDLRAAGVPCGLVNSVGDALADVQTAARELIVETDHPTFGRVRQVRSPVRVGHEVPSYRRAPRRREGSDRVLRDLLQYDDSTVMRLTTGGAFGPARMDPL